jgi:hypothetical protein
MKLYVALSACSSKEQIDSLFHKFGIEDLQKRTEELIHCMGDPEIYGSSSGDIALEYKITVCMFLAGAWKDYVEPWKESFGERIQHALKNLIQH